MPRRTYEFANPTNVTLDGDFSYRVVTTKHFYATKLSDVRYQSRRYYMLARKAGIEADYFEAYFCPACVRDPYNYTYDNVAFEEGMYRFNTECPICNNRGIIYLPPKKIKVFIPDNRQIATQTESGRIEQEAGIIHAPLVAGFKRLDILRIMDKIWMIVDEPKYLYAQHRGNLIGYLLSVKGLRHTISKY